jgi:hypothetical protein
MKKRPWLIVTVITCIALLGAVIHGQVKNAKAQAAPITDELLKCMAREISSYMDTVIQDTGFKAGRPSHIKYLSPAFNLPSPYEQKLFDFMLVSNPAANFGELDGFAGNTYSNITGAVGIGAYEWISRGGWTNRFKKPDTLVITEFGDFELRGSSSVSNLAKEFQKTAADGKIKGINLFNALGKNPEFAYAIMSPAEINQVIAANPAKGGINSASWFDPGFPAEVNAVNSQIGWNLQIATGPQDKGTVIQSVNNAPPGMKTIVRLCAAATPPYDCGFVNPQDLVQFIRDLDAGIQGNREAWVIIGPNEPVTERWLGKACVTTPDGPMPSPHIPCSETNDKAGESEFHVQRPYQASPCDADKQPKPEQQTLRCGNDMVIRKSHFFLPSDAQSCVSNPSAGTETCHFKVDKLPETAQVKVDLSQSKLPIAGNTEAVYNWYNPQSVIDEKTRMTEYLDWYLQGTAYSANDPSMLSTPKDKEGIDRLVNYAGPINKLMPERLFRVTKQNETVGPAGDTTHNEIIACMGPYTVPGTLITVPATYQCFDGFPGTKKRMGDYKRGSGGGDDPPFEEDYADQTDFYTDYKNWTGNQFCITIPFLGGRVCMGSGPKNALAYWQIPWAKTDDIVGKVEIPRSLPGGPGLDFNIENAQFIPNLDTGVDSPPTYPSNAHKLYFPHLGAIAGLSEILQSTYIPKDQPGWSKVEGTLGDASDTKYPGCEVVDTATNPGDDLFGEHNTSQAQYKGPDSQSSDAKTQERPGSYTGGYPPKDTDLSGQIAYTISAEFDCTFPLPVPNPKCLSDRLDEFCSDFDPSSDDYTQCYNEQAAACTPTVTACEKKSQITVPVSVATPKIKETWERLVDDKMSVFKRFYPMVDPTGTLVLPLKEIKDTPGVTSASYIGEGSGIEVLSGDPSKGKSGSQAEIYFPHLGGLQEYFMKGIQQALLPYGYGPKSDDGSSSGPNPGDPNPGGPGPVDDTFPKMDCPTVMPNLPLPSDGVTCNPQCPNRTIPAKFDGAMKAAFIDIAQRWTSHPEGTHAEECYNYVVSESLSAGVNPVYSLTIWLQESDASNYVYGNCDPAHPEQTVQDFGINTLKYPGNFNSQLKQFLRLPYIYPINFAQCFPDNKCTIPRFSRVYREGATSSCQLTATAVAYAEKTKRNMQKFTQCVPKYPTDMSCP